MHHADKEVGTEMSEFVDESSKATAYYRVERATWSLLEKEDGEYARLLEGALDVMTVPEENIGANSVIPWTNQHLYGQVIAQRVAQGDHLETEEAVVIPLIRENPFIECQLEAVGVLLIDHEADD